MRTTEVKLPQDAWLEEFQRIYVDGIDTDLINTIVRSLRWGAGYETECNVARMMHICNDKVKWIYAPKKAGGRKKGQYWRLRRVSDFLGLPPWLILLTDSNVLLYTLFELKSAKFEEYPLVDFGRTLVNSLSLTHGSTNDKG